MTNRERRLAPIESLRASEQGRELLKEHFDDPLEHAVRVAREALENFASMNDRVSIEAVDLTDEGTFGADVQITPAEADFQSLRAGVIDGLTEAEINDLAARKGTFLFREDLDMPQFDWFALSESWGAQCDDGAIEGWMSDWSMQAVCETEIDDFWTDVLGLYESVFLKHVTSKLSEMDGEALKRVRSAVDALQSPQMVVRLPFPEDAVSGCFEAAGMAPRELAAIDELGGDSAGMNDVVH